jgi:hypothetical protein
MFPLPRQPQIIQDVRTMSWIKLMLCRSPLATGLSCCLLLIGACSSPNAEAPTPDQVHEPAYILEHAGLANADLDRCKTCHASNLNGGNQVPSCFDCHENSLPITLHPVPYTDPDAHGAAGRNDLARCFGCHGSPPNLFDGGVLSDPSLFNIASANCSTTACHPDAGAHPTRWQGGNDNTGGYLSSHRTSTEATVQDSCALCHQVRIGGSRPMSQAPSCFAAGFTNGDNVTGSCHPGGFTPDHGLPYADPNDHGPAARADLSECQVCHGTPGTIAFNGGSASTACSATACHPDAGAHPTNWANNDSGGYTSTHTNAGRTTNACIICHDVTQGRTAPNTAAPSCFSTDFTNGNNITTGCHPGGAIPDHGLPYTAGSSHGGPAKADLTDCQACHGEPGTIYFDGGSAPTACSATACHPDAGAHPSSWRSGHRSAGRMNSTCIICHDVTQGRTAPNTAAPSCYAGSFGGSSCHSGGPGD